MSERNSRQNTRRSSGRREPRVEISGARIVAFDVLRDVAERDAYANLALPSRIRAAGLGPRDAALATELAAGVLRGRGRYDRIIELAADRETDRIDPRTLDVLRLGAHQLLSMRTAAHAAVNESVELQRRVAEARAAGFVNGVLRTIGRASTEQWDERIDAASSSPDASLADRFSHPEWVVRALRDALRAEGRENELEDLLAADNLPPRVNLALLHETQGLDQMLDQSVVSASGPSPVGYESAGGDPSRIVARSGIAEGLLRVQDQGSQLAALALTRARPVGEGERWLDLCAGPGGKAALLGAEALRAGSGRGGVTVRANEVSAHRAELVRRSVIGVADAVTVVSHDGREPDAYGDGADSRRTYDRILVDAPCSGLGALRRRPEARWRKLPSDLPELTELQSELLSRAADHLAPGGILAYVTCSPHLAETRAVLDRLLRSRTDLCELDAKSVLNEVAREPLGLAGPQLSAQLWPHRNGTDAMFVSLIERSPEIR